MKVESTEEEKTYNVEMNGKEYVVIEHHLVNIELPKCIDERIEKWSYEDETHSPIIEEVTEVDWKH